MSSRDFWVLGLRAECSQESFAQSDFPQNSPRSIFLEATPDWGVWVGLDGWGARTALPETSGKTSASVRGGTLEVPAGARHVARGGLGLLTLGYVDAWRAGGGGGDAHRSLAAGQGIGGGCPRLRVGLCSGFGCACSSGWACGVASLWLRLAVAVAGLFTWLGCSRVTKPLLRLFGFAALH